MAFLTFLAPHSRAEEAPAPAAQAPKPRALPPGEEAYRQLTEALGPEAVEILVERGYAFRYGDKKRPGLLHLQAAPLLALVQRGHSPSDFLALYEAVKTGQAPADPPPDLRGLLKLKTSGLWTPGLKAAAEVLCAHLDNLAALGEQAKTAPKPLLFAAPWSAALLSRTHADLIGDFRPLAGLYFAEFLAAIDRPAEAPAHFLAYVKAAYGKELDPVLERDLKSASLSEELTGWIAKYLLDQKRLWSVSLTRGKLAALERSTTLTKDLRDLRAAAGALESAGSALAQISTTLSQESPSPRLRFSSERLHVHSDLGLPFDQGDSVLVTAAYWVEGGDPGESVPVSEAGFLDGGPSGVSQTYSSSNNRKPGGPYLVSARVSLPLPGKRKFRLLLGAPDAEPLRLETDIEISPRLPDFLQQAAHAESLASACRLEEAAREFAELDGALAPLAGKAQFKRLKASLEPRQKLLAKQVQTYKTLAESLPGVRLHAGKDQCDFRPERAQRALAMLAELPPGCGQLSGSGESREGASSLLAVDLQSLLDTTQRRAMAQEAFRAALEKGRKEENSCRFREAADLYSGALALLDADPETRCGWAEKEYTRTRLTDLPRARAGTAVADSLAKAQGEGTRLYASRDYGGALGVLTPLVARIDVMADGRCYEGQRRKAEELALAAGASLAPPDPRTVKAGLPQDPAGDEVKEVGAERMRLNKLEEARRERELRRQAPPAPAVSKSAPAASAAVEAPSAPPAPITSAPAAAKDAPASVPAAAPAGAATPADAQDPNAPKPKKRKKKKSLSGKNAPRSAYDSNQPIVIPKETQEKLNRSKALREAQETAQ